MTTTNGIPPNPDTVARAQRMATLRKLLTDPDAQRALDNAANNPPPTQAYMPLGKTLAALGITPLIRDIDIAGETIQCLLIPVRDLVNKEWVALTGGIVLGTEPSTES